MSKIIHSTSQPINRRKYASAHSNPYLLTLEIVSILIELKLNRQQVSSYLNKRML